RFVDIPDDAMELARRPVAARVRLTARGLSTRRLPPPLSRGPSRNPRAYSASRDLLRLTRPDEDECSLPALPATTNAQTPTALDLALRLAVDTGLQEHTPRRVCSGRTRIDRQG